ncbi:SusD/RagB family nutrient-binding outer membrane lipoprotein [Parabacteroides sp. OttesenSCG-928-N08]|nr:SusD/RagB family nutrient-binding outer membrane lipoprotein [Parabacteroides sp. OttesenSCG-928-N08]
MKKILSILFGLVLVFNLCSCAEEDYTEKYADPAKTNKVSCEKLMTGMFYIGRDYTFNTYWRMYTWDNGIIGTYSQTIGFTNSSNGLYSANDSYANSRWENFYNVLAQYRLMEKTYEELAENQKPIYRVFVCLAEIYLYDHLSQMIDIFGDVPFSTAGYLGITSDVVASYASYDSQADLYTMMLDNLGALYAEIRSISGNIENLPLTVKYLSAQDFYNDGDLDKWMRYCNSLRLRLAVRVSSQGALAAKGKTVVAEILNGNLPLVSNLSQTIMATPDTDGFNYGDQFRDGYKDHSRAPQAMIDVLYTKASLGENDPRLPIMYSANAKGEYKGLSTINETLYDQQQNIALPESQRVYSRIDSTTVIYNRQLLSPIVTAAEVDFLRAEAYQKGWANGDAKAAFIAGMLHSAEFYFLENSVSTSGDGTKMDMPAESVVTGYAEKVWNAASNKEVAIITQKWLNFGYMQPSQAWNEIRRTGYPSLYYPEDPMASILKTVPNRVMYPNTEKSYNNANYSAQIQKMGGSDDPYIKIFWAK